MATISYNKIKFCLKIEEREYAYKIPLIKQFLKKSCK